MDDIIEAVDYIFDRYAFLKLAKNSNLKEIQTAIRQARAENHPDKFIRASQEIQNLAQKQNDLLSQCEAALLNPDIKPLYDEKLTQFLKEKPQLVSINGTPIIDAFSLKVDLTYLLQEKFLDIEDLKNKVSQMSNYNCKKIEKAQKRYQSSSEDIELRDELREELTKKLVYLTIMEDFYWQKAGIQGISQKNEDIRAQSSDDIVAIFEEKLIKVPQLVQTAIENRNGAALLGFSEPLLIGYSTELNNNSQEKIFSQVMKNFKLQEKDLRDLLQEKKDTIDALIQVSRTKQLRASSHNEICDIIISISNDDDFYSNWPNPSSQVSSMAFRLDKNSGIMDTITFDKSCTQNMIASYPHELWLIELNKEITSPLLEIMALANRLSSQ